MADFIAPKESNVDDYIGMFAVSTGFRQEIPLAQFEKDDDQYSIIMLKTLADRFAEAFAEYLHCEVRKNYWGYTPNESLDFADILNVKY